MWRRAARRVTREEQARYRSLEMTPSGGVGWPVEQSEDVPHLSGNPATPKATSVHGLPHAPTFMTRE